VCSGCADEDSPKVSLDAIKHVNATNPKRKGFATLKR